MSKEEIKFEGVDNGYTIGQWMLIDDKYHHIIITFKWLPNGKLNHKLYLNGELESENGVKYIKPKEDENKN